MSQQNPISTTEQPPAQQATPDEAFEIKVVTPQGEMTKAEVLSAGHTLLVEHHEDAGKRTGDRLIAFFDAVMAIAITLLALEIAPPATEIFDTRALGQLFLPFTALFISYLALGQSWLIHVKMFGRTDYKATNASLWLHLLLMFFVILFPKTTSLITTYPGSIHATVIYLACFAGMIATESVLVGMARQQQLGAIERAYKEHYLPTFDRTSISELVKDSASHQDDLSALLRNFVQILATESALIIINLICTIAAVMSLFVSPAACYVFFVIDLVVSILCWRRITRISRTANKQCAACSLSIRLGG